MRGDEKICVGGEAFPSNLRHRALDAIPYRSSLVFDMEPWHSHNCEVDYRTGCWRYRLHDGSDDTAIRP